jgi:hypothetical protein
MFKGRRGGCLFSAVSKSKAPPQYGLVREKTDFWYVTAVSAGVVVEIDVILSAGGRLASADVQGTRVSVCIGIWAENVMLS